MFGLSYWVMPLFAACCWFATLLAMLLVWATTGKQHYPSEAAGAHIPYISDIGASNLKPLFIAGSAVTVVVFDLSFISERWLRHTGRLAHNTTKLEKACSIISVIAAIIGAAGLIFLTIFDTLHYHDVHDSMLCVFIGGYVVSAIFVCIEYQRLGIHFREYRILRMSFWLKLAFIFIEVALAIVFGVMDVKGHYDTAAIFEWIVSLIYIFYVASYVLDFIPAIHSKKHRFPGIDEIEDADNDQRRNGANGPSMSGGPTYSENDSYGSAQPMSQVSGDRYYNASSAGVEPSRNF